MFEKQKSFNLAEETKTCVISNNTSTKIVEDIFKGLNLSQEVLKKDFEIINTLGKLSMKKVVVINEDKIFKSDKLSRLLNIKEDVLILVDTFKDAWLLFERLTTSTYKFLVCKSKDVENEVKRYYFSDQDISQEMNEGVIYGEAINHTKDLVNKPYNYLNAVKLAEYANDFNGLDNVEVTIYGKKEIQEMNMGAFLGVNKGSSDDPQLIHIRYTGDQDSKDIVSLIGKGVMYDTGGYSLKTPAGMPNMKSDMAGAATVLGAIEIIAKLKYKKNVDVVIAATDNRIGDGAIVPDDILTSAKGITIEIISTDAEGRLTLADALWFAQKQGANKLIDIATLTGAIVRALGKEFTGAFTNNQDFLNELLQISKTTEEGIWQMPMSEGYGKELKSFSADTRNGGTTKLAGGSVAASFLEKFVEDSRPWIHLDIAGTAFESKKGGSGVMVKTLAEYFKS
jgi:leucyl aminopeptidase